MTDQPVRVMVVDDSAVIRGAITRILEKDSEIKVVASAGNGAAALAALPRLKPDIIILDIEMPVLDGLTALPQILRAAPEARVIMASTLTQRGAEISLKALSLGAIDVLPKPMAGAIFGADDFARDLVQKVLALGRTRPSARSALGPPQAQAAAEGRVRLRAAGHEAASIVGIGASTGGPQALQAVLSGLPAAFQLPIVVVQHMPPTFTRLLAGELARVGRRPACEGQDEMPVERGHVYVAPGGNHMTVERRKDGTVLRLNRDPPENYCRPAVDPLFRSLAGAYGGGTLAVVLTGMGSDGARGATTIAAAGGTVLAQDEASSVVWGMPGAVAALGLCSALVPLSDMARRIGELARMPVCP